MGDVTRMDNRTRRLVRREEGAKTVSWERREVSSRVTTSDVIKRLEALQASSFAHYRQRDEWIEGQRYRIARN
jgi:hypothetical protein